MTPRIAQNYISIKNCNGKPNLVVSSRLNSADIIFQPFHTLALLLAKPMTAQTRGRNNHCDSLFYVVPRLVSIKHGSEDELGCACGFQVCRSNRWCARGRRITLLSTTTSATRGANPKKRGDRAILSRAPPGEGPDCPTRILFSSLHQEQFLQSVVCMSAI